MTSTSTRRFVHYVAYGLFRHKKKALLVFFGILALTIGAMARLPRTYLSEAKLFVRLGRESVTLDPTATTGQTVGLVDTREMEINSVLEVLRSRSLAEKVVDKLSVDKILARDEADPAATSGPSVMSRLMAPVLGFFRGMDPVDDRERAVTAVERSLAVSAPKRTTVIDLGCKARSPELAREILAALIEVYHNEHTRLNRTVGSLDFFREQSTLLHAQLADALEQLRQAKNDSGLVSIDGQRDMLQQQMTSVEADILSSEGAVASSGAKLSALQVALKRHPERVVTEEVSGVALESSDGMRQSLYLLEMKEAELRSRYTASHPAIREIRKQVEDARAILERQNKSRTHSTLGMNPVRQPLLIELAQEETNLAAVSARLASLNTQRGTVLARLRSLNDHELKIVAAQRRVNELESSYHSYAEKFEQARVDEALVRDRISNVNLAQAPTFMARPVSPNKPVLMAAGLILAICGCIGTALLAEYFDATVRAPEEVQESLGLAVLMTIPRTPPQEILVH